jgi:hypothetical protein
MFLGTPHGGADPRGFLQHVAEKAIKAAGFSVNKQIVDTLLPSAERLKELRDEFSPMAHQQGWIIHSFQEEIGVNLLSGHKVRRNVHRASRLASDFAGCRGRIVIFELANH